MEITRVFDYLENLKKFAPCDDILARKFQGKWIKYSIDEYIENAHLVACGLLALGYKEGTKVVSLCNNRPEWNFLDMGVTLAHMIHVPVYSTLSADEYTYIFDHSDAEIIVIGNMNFYKKVIPVIEKMTRPVKVILMDTSDTVFCFQDLYEKGRENREAGEEIIKRNIKEISPDDVASIIYTSGTTGTPKGVMLTHRNLTFDAHTHAVRQTKNNSHIMVSFLPLCHAYERTMNYEYQELGIRTYYAESLGTVAADLKDCHADGFCAVPRVLELMYGKFEAAAKTLKGLSKKIYLKAWNYANNFDNYNTKWWYLKKQKIYDKLVYSKWRANLGGHEMLVVSGGSSIQGKIVRTFNAAKLFIFEGYGMTEASPVIAVNSPADKYNKIGTVGKAIGGSELSFAPDGEILTRGPHVMKGYYKDPEATKAVIDEEGWLHTGDIGYLVEGEYLKITDRKKEIFKLSSGKYVAPQTIETQLKTSPYVDNSIIVGENQKLVAAIIIPNFNHLKDYASEHRITFENNEELLTKPEIVQLMRNAVDEVNKNLAPHENIKKYRLINDEWTPGNNMLSQTLKLKRRNIVAKYKEVIDEMFAN